MVGSVGHSKKGQLQEQKTDQQLMESENEGEVAYKGTQENFLERWKCAYLDYGGGGLLKTC